MISLLLYFSSKISHFVSVFPPQYTILIYHHWRFYKLHSHLLSGTIYASTTSSDKCLIVVRAASVLTPKFLLKIAFDHSCPPYIQVGFHRKKDMGYYLWRTFTGQCFWNWHPWKRIEGRKVGCMEKLNECIPNKGFHWPHRDFWNEDGMWELYWVGRRAFILLCGGSLQGASHRKKTTLRKVVSFSWGL